MAGALCMASPCTWIGMRGSTAGGADESCTVSPNSICYDAAAHVSGKSKSASRTSRSLRNIRRFPGCFLAGLHRMTINPLEASKASRRCSAVCSLQSSDVCGATETGHEGSKDDESMLDQRVATTTVHDNRFGVPTTLFSSVPIMLFTLAVAADESSTSYSKASYYTSLGLFVLSAPGLWSLIKRSAKSKVVRKTFVIPGPKVPDAKPLRQFAGEISSFFTRNNFRIKDTGEVVTFEGTMMPSRGQAAFLTFCTAVGLASIALVLTITVPDVGPNWYWLTTLSPLAGVYYWTRATRTEQIRVKMVTSDDESTTDVVVEGDDEQVDLLRRELALMEKNMVYVKGILER